MSVTLAAPLIQISEEFQQALAQVEAAKQAAQADALRLQRALESSEMQSSIVSEQFKQLMREHVRFLCAVCRAGHFYSYCGGGCLCVIGHVAGSKARAY